MTDSELSKALAELDEQKVSTLVRKRIGSGVDAMSVIKELQEGMDTLGTVKGDIHNIGKDIVAVLLRASGFEVYDLSVDVPPTVFVNKLIETRAPILGMSGLLTPAFESMKETVKAVEAAGLRNKVKIIIGGGVVTELVKKHAGADAFTTDAVEGVEMCKQFAKGAK